MVQSPMAKNAIEREQSQWSKTRLSESKAKLACAMPSVSVFGEANVQWSMVNGQCPMAYSCQYWSVNSFLIFTSSSLKYL